jgi:hypothetical protein
MKNGSVAKLIVPTVQGTIAETRWNNEQDKKEYLLKWTDGDGNECARWFFEDELEEVVAK